MTPTDTPDQKAALDALDNISLHATQQAGSFSHHEEYLLVQQQVKTIRAALSEPDQLPGEVLEALKDFQEIAAIAKANCGPKLRALIQAAQEKHATLEQHLKGEG